MAQPQPTPREQALMEACAAATRELEQVRLENKLLREKIEALEA